MNIQQLNQNGQNIWVFVTTAAVALLVTGGSWACSKSAYKARAWYKERVALTSAMDGKVVKTEYDLLLRIAMLLWLVRTGHGVWTWKTGAWLAILMNSSVLGEQTAWPWVEARACDYVAKYGPTSTKYGTRIEYGGDRFKFPPDHGLHWSPVFGYPYQLCLVLALADQEIL